MPSKNKPNLLDGSIKHVDLNDTTLDLRVTKGLKTEQETKIIKSTGVSDENSRSNPSSSSALK